MKIIYIILCMLAVSVLTAEERETSFVGNILTAKTIETSNINISLNQFLVIDVENSIVGMTIAHNRYGLLRVERLSDKSLVVLLNKNNDDNEAILKAFKGKILLADNKCNKYLLNINVSNKKDISTPKYMLLKQHQDSKSTCKAVNKGNSRPYQRAMMLN